MSYPTNDILDQCRPGADVLLDNFRNDVSCEVLQRFKAKGLTLVDLLKLQRIIPVVYPWDKNYDSLRYIVNRRFVVFPWMIVMCKNTKDVQISVKWGYKWKIPMIPRGGSHCFENFSLIDGMIIDQSRRTNLSLRDNFAIVDPGCLQGPVQIELAKHKLAFVGGTCPNVGAAAISLGGGIGFLVRLYGLSCDNLLEAEVILARGDIIRTNKKQYADLFWALQGGGLSNFGIITKLVYKVHYIPEVTIFDLIFPYDQLRGAINIWQRWAPFTVDELTSELDIYQDHVLVTGQFVGPKDQLKKLIKPILKLKPTEVTIKTIPFIEAVRHFAGQGHWFPFFKNRSGFVKKFLPDEALDIIQKYMRFGGPEDHVELNAFGGVVSRIPARKTAFPHRGDTLYWCHLQCHWLYQDLTESKLKWVNNFYSELEPYLSGAYANAPDLELDDPLQKYYGVNLPRLRQIKNKYNPENIFKYAQAIPPN